MCNSSMGQTSKISVLSGPSNAGVWRQLKQSLAYFLSPSNSVANWLDNFFSSPSVRKAAFSLKGAVPKHHPQGYLELWGPIPEKLHEIWDRCVFLKKDKLFSYR